MSELKLNNLNIDLIQDQATIGLFAQRVSPVPGKAAFTAVNVQVPIQAPANLNESGLKASAVTAAIETLEEAIRVLRTSPAW